MNYGNKAEGIITWSGAWNSTSPTGTTVADLTMTIRVNNLSSHYKLTALTAKSWTHVATESTAPSFTTTGPCIIKWTPSVTATYGTGYGFYYIPTAGSYTASNGVFGFDPGPGGAKLAYLCYLSNMTLTVNPTVSTTLDWEIISSYQTIRTKS